VVTTAALGLLLFHPAFRVDAVRFEGVQRLSEEQLRTFAPIQQLQGQPRFAVDPEPLAQALREAFPGIRAAQVTVPWQGPVRITLVEREPALVWESPQGEVWLDREGVAFALGDEIQAEGYPRLAVLPAEGQPWPEPPSAAEIQHLLALYARLPQGTKLVYHPLRGYGWYTREGWPVFIGHQLQDFERQWAVYRRLYPLLGQQGWTPAWIDLSDWQHPIVHLAKEGIASP